MQGEKVWVESKAIELYYDSHEPFETFRAECLGFLLGNGLCPMNYLSSKSSTAEHNQLPQCSASVCTHSETQGYQMA